MTHLLRLAHLRAAGEERRGDRPAPQGQPLALHQPLLPPELRDPEVVGGWVGR